ncbi:MAG: hypothetical protein K6A71_00190 [Lachnospiraceae bacterium]|nr:hypothetical protein [Lachnospiraceae bacterium]
MKYSLDTYRLYQKEDRFPYVIRVKVTMKEPVDADILKDSVNTAITRYPYFCVRVSTGEDGGYTLLKNDRPVAVLPLARAPRYLCSDEVNDHLLFVEYDGQDIYFNISHSLCGGRGAFPWVMTNVYQYVKDRYHILPDAPGIRKPGEPLLAGEDTEPTIDMLTDEPKIYTRKAQKHTVMVVDYMNGLFNPLKRSETFHVFEFSQSDVMELVGGQDSSVNSFFMVAMARSLDRLLPDKNTIICGECAHNTFAGLGIQNSHCDMLAHILVDYKREQLKWDMNKLGTMTRGQFILQTDPSYSHPQMRKLFKLYDEIDQISGLKNKRAYMAKHNPSSGKDAEHGTFLVNYTGQMHWGEVADYVESYVAVVAGHLVLEISSMEGKIFISFMQMIKGNKYIDAFCRTLYELGLKYKLSGPFPKHLAKHRQPTE